MKNSLYPFPTRDSKYYIVVALVYLSRTDKRHRMAGYILGNDKQDAYFKAKAHCMDLYNCRMYNVGILALSLAKDQELAENIPSKIDIRSYEELINGGLFYVERDILNLISNSTDKDIDN